MGYLDATLTWMLARLRADTALTGLLAAPDAIYTDAGPDGAALPFVIVQLQSPGQDVGAAPSTRVLTAGTWLVKAVVRGRSYAPAVPIDARLDAVLQGAQGTTPAGTVFGCVRTAPFSLAEDTPTVKYRHLGGTYRVAAR